VSLSVQRLRAGYGATKVLHGVDLEVAPGTVVALLGANGAGKTTLLRACSGLLRASSGAVMLDGEDVTGLAPHALARRGLCHVPEGRAIYPDLTVTENLKIFADGASDAIERGTAPFPALRAKLAQRAGTLSGGEQQMLALTRAYLCQPRYVLLDEVSLGLAPMIVDVIFDSLRELAAKGAAMLLVEQYVHKALELADTYYVLAKGRVAFSGMSSELDTEQLAEAYLGAH
jgi:branched-chain amino acid transport system ATP-binding protein